MNETQVEDTTAPVTTSTVSGNSVSLSVVDDNSGVANTVYSTDGGNTWANYNGPIILNPLAGQQNIVVEYFSTDKAGTMEQFQYVNVPIIGIQKINNESGGYIKMRQSAINILPMKIPEFINNTNSKQISIEKEIAKTGRYIKKEKIPFLLTKSIKTKKDNMNLLTAQAISSNFEFKIIYLLYIIVGICISLFINKKFNKNK